ncbi:MAG: efflux RND transporter periplasmic adaptor subunit [Thermodesulfobacteriota bacterium]
MNGMKSIRVLLILFLLVASCGGGSDSDKKDADSDVIKGVGTERVHKKVVVEYYSTSGTVRAKTVSDVASRAMGTVTSIKVREGDTVAEGDVLLTLDDRDFRQRALAAKEAYSEALHYLETAESSKRLTELTYERYKSLYDDKAISAHEMDEMESQREIAASEFERARASLGRAKANMEEAEINLGFTEIRSPVTGIVTGKEAEVGSMAVPGRVLLRVEDNSSFRLDVNVDEKMSGRLEPGMTVYADVDALGSRLEGTVTEVVPAVDPSTRTFLVKIGLGGESLKTGLYGTVLIPSGKREAILIPRSAVVEKGQLEGVYTVDENGTATYRLVRTGREYDGNVEVLSGLRDGDVVVVEGAGRVTDGVRVEVD